MMKGQVSEIAELLAEADAEGVDLDSLEAELAKRVDDEEWAKEVAEAAMAESQRQAVVTAGEEGVWRRTTAAARQAADRVKSRPAGDDHQEIKQQTASVRGPLHQAIELESSTLAKHADHECSWSPTKEPEVFACDDDLFATLASEARAPVKSVQALYRETAIRDVPDMILRMANADSVRGAATLALSDGSYDESGANELHDDDFEAEDEHQASSLDSSLRLPLEKALVYADLSMKGVMPTTPVLSMPSTGRSGSSSVYFRVTSEAGEAGVTGLVIDHSGSDNADIHVGVCSSAMS